MFHSRPKTHVLLSMNGKSINGRANAFSRLSSQVTQLFCFSDGNLHFFHSFKTSQCSFGYGRAVAFFILAALSSLARTIVFVAIKLYAARLYWSKEILRFSSGQKFLKKLRRVMETSIGFAARKASVGWLFQPQLESISQPVFSAGK